MDPASAINSDSFARASSIEALDMLPSNGSFNHGTWERFDAR